MKRANKENCFANALKVAEYARRFTRGHWSFPGPESEKKWFGTHVNKLDGDLEKSAEGMMLNFAESGHPILRARNALARGELNSTRKGVKSIHFKGSDDTIKLILRTVVSVNQLRIYGAVANFCKEIAKNSPSATKHAEILFWESMVVPTEFPNANTVSQTDMSAQRNLLREYEQKLAELPEQEKIDQTLLQCWVLGEHREKTVLHYPGGRT